MSKAPHLYREARKVVREIETLIGHIDVELRLGTARRHLDPRVELLGYKMRRLMFLQHNGHTVESLAIERRIEEVTRRVESLTELKVKRAEERPSLRVVK